MKKVAGKIILYSNILFAFLLLFSYSAPYINPAKILIPAFLGLAYPFLLLINLVYLLYYLIRMKKEMVISLVVIAIGWNHLMNFIPINLSSGIASENTGQSTDLSVLSYNVRTFDQLPTQDEESVEGIFELIRDQSPIVLCMQEFSTTNKAGRREVDVSRKLGDYPYNSIYYSANRERDYGVGIATFSKLPIVKTSRIPFNNSRNQAIYTDLVIEGDTVRLFNIHLQSIRFGQSNYSFLDTLSFKYSTKQIQGAKDIGIRLRDAFVQRAEQADMIHQYIQLSPYPVVVTGDFNDTPQSYAYRKIKRGLKDAFRIAGKGFGNTYAGELPSFRIDYVMYSKDFIAQEFKRIKSKHSDHFPVYARLKWNRSEEAD